MNGSGNRYSVILYSIYRYYVSVSDCSDLQYFVELLVREEDSQILI